MQSNDNYSSRKKESSYLRFQVDHILNPVTALAYIDFRSRILLLTGEGPLLRIYDQSSGERLLSHRILSSHAIHGIAASSVISQHPLNVCSFRALLWGDRCVSVVEIEPSTQSKWPTKLKILDLVTETLLEDWILDAQLRPQHEDRVDTNLDDAIVITAHNHLLHLQFPQQSIRDAEITICHAAKGPRSMLYSAHTTWSLEGRVLIAAGTIFGEVIVWSFDGIDISSISEDAVPGTLHYVFKGHEGSVFGVRISDVLADKCSKSAQRVVASCSDDRTIRLWDISRLDTNLSWTENQETPSVPSNSRREDASNIDIWNDANKLLAKATGHSSRVWGVRFIYQIEEELIVLSFGEDATSQLWRLSCPYDEQVNEPELQKNLLRHEVVYEFNCGKNLWAIAVHELLDNDCLIAMGGADGRIVCFSLNKEQRILKSGSSNRCQFTMPQVCKNLEKREISPTFDEIMAAKTHIRASPERLFDIFQGTWKLFRALRSALSVYPSGYFEGTAIFEQRPSTSEVYDKEYLYIENGQFTTNQGLVLMANRRYIYRYQKDVDKISVWFVRQDGATADYLFHEVNFSTLQDGPLAHKRVGDTEFFKANGQHLCVHDDYQANYLFEFIGSNCNEWGVKYNVKGPKKDYVADNRYIRENSVKTWKKELDHEQIIDSSSAIYESKLLAMMRDSLSKRLFKSYTWINENELLLSTDHGVLIWGTLSSLKREEDYSPERHSTSWKVVGEPTDCRNSCIFSTIRSHGIVHLAGANGTIFYYQHAVGLNPGIRVPAKVGYLKSHLIDNCSSLDRGQNSSCKLGIIAVCLGSPIVHIVVVNLNSKFSNYFASDCRINCESDFVVTSSCFIRSEELLVLGSRNGYIIIYDISVKKGLRDFPIKSCYLRNVHGKDTVTTIEKFSAKASNSYISCQYILTTGRDGTFSIHHIMTDRGKNNELSLKFETVHVGTPPLGPNIEGSYFGPTPGQLYIWGFRNKDFVVWNETKKTEIMVVECGGPHRNWAFIPKDDGSGGNLVWTKVSTCNIYLSTHASHRVMQSGGHGREIKTMAISSGIKSTDGSVRRLIATGAEDTNIRIFGHDTANVADEGGFECLGIIVRHKTGLQKLRWSSNGQLLFSSGGCEEFFVWRIRLVPMIEVGIVCEARCPAVTDSSDLRIMNFDFTEVGDIPDCSRYIISMVYSDSSVRIFSYNGKTFETMCVNSYSTYCLTQAVHLQANDTFQLLTASTDGHIAIWPIVMTETLQRKVRRSPSNQPPPPSSLTEKALSPLQLNKPHTRIKIHQSSIKALMTIRLSPSTILVATGGDDGALAFTRIVINNDLNAPTPPPPHTVQHSTLLIPKAHASAINAFTSIGHHTTTTATTIPPIIIVQEKKKKKHAAAARPPPPSQPNPKSILRFATAGNDQRLKIWQLLLPLPRTRSDDATGCQQQQQQQQQEQENPEMHDCDIARESNAYTSIADVSCMEAYTTDEDGTTTRIVIGGVGMESLRYC